MTRNCSVCSRRSTDHILTAPSSEPVMTNLSSYTTNEFTFKVQNAQTAIRPQLNVSTMLHRATDLPIIYKLLTFLQHCKTSNKGQVSNKRRVSIKCWVFFVKCTNNCQVSNKRQVPNGRRAQYTSI